MFGPREWARRIGPAGAVTILSIGAAWAAIGLLVAGRLRDAVLVALLAFLLDNLDGLVARRTGTASEFGRTFDSLADLVNYSVWAALATSLWIAPGPWGWAVGAVMVAGGAIRLARFSVDGFDDGPIAAYRGVVTPHLTLAAMVLLMLVETVGIPAWASLTVLTVLAVGQLAGFRMRKTGRQLYWVALVIPLALGAVLWLP